MRQKSVKRINVISHKNTSQTLKSFSPKNQNSSLAFSINFTNTSSWEHHLLGSVLRSRRWNLSESVSFHPHYRSLKHPKAETLSEHRLRAETIIMYSYTHVVGRCTHWYTEANQNFERFLLLVSHCWNSQSNRVKKNSRRINLADLFVTWMWIMCDSLTSLLLSDAQMWTVTGAEQTRRRSD